MSLHLRQRHDVRAFFRSQGGELSRALALGGVTTLGLGLLRQGLGLFGALGTDAPLWGLTARDLLSGAPPLVPPLYPALLVPMIGLGHTPAAAGTAASLVMGGCLASVGYLCARRWGMSRAGASVAAIAPFLLPDTLGFALQLQPDAAAAVVALGLAYALTKPAELPVWSIGLAALAPLVREHGIVWMVLLCAVLVWHTPKRPSRALGLLLAATLAPLVVGVLPGWHPMDVPWSDRAGGALAAFMATPDAPPPYLHELHAAERRAYLDLLAAADRGGQLVWHAARSVRLAPDGWLLVVLALTLPPSPHKEARWRVVPLLAALPALVIWSQRRHLLVLAPLAIVYLLAHTPRPRLTRPLLVVVLAAHGAVNLPAFARGWQSEGARARHYAEVGAFLQTSAQPGDLLGGVFQDIGLYGPDMPRHDPDGSPADWRTWTVTDRAPPQRARGTWTSVFTGSGPYHVYQLDPERSPRPCADARLPPGAAHLAIAEARVTLAGCVEPVEH